MANITLHNIKSVNFRLGDYTTFCTLELRIETKSEWDNEPQQEKIELYFDSIEDREQFIVPIANLLMPE